MRVTSKNLKYLRRLSFVLIILFACLLIYTRYNPSFMHIPTYLRDFGLVLIVVPVLLMRWSRTREKKEQHK